MCFLPPEIGKHWYDIESINDESDCPLPCTTYTIQKKFLGEYTQPNMLSMTFPQRVQVTTTNMMTPPMSSFLSEVGGSMGLWLGLGVLQAVEMVLNIALPWLRREREEK
jgi:hypothetical protein